MSERNLKYCMMLGYHANRLIAYTKPNEYAIKLFVVLVTNGAQALSPIIIIPFHFNRLLMAAHWDDLELKRNKNKT
uniref:Methionine aminopeptidase 1Dic/mitochondrial-like n=1 Tax=Rhizophora mucronata TaxID=61149 RepID=A0A2P2KXE1_RHIMU